MGFRVRARGAAFSQTEVQAETIVPLFSLLHSQPIDTGAIDLNNTGDSLKLHLSQLMGSSKLPPVIYSIQMGCLDSCCELS